MVNSTRAITVASFRETFCRVCKPHFVGVWDTVGSIGWLKAFRQFRHNNLSPGVEWAFHAISIDEKRIKFPVTLWNEVEVQAHQHIDQVWFAGVHCDVGGGYEDHTLANIPFNWMLGHARDKGLKVRDGYQDKWKGDANGQIHQSYRGWWRWLPSRIRTIPVNAKIHDSVWDRYNADPSYRPTNLPPRP